MNEELLDAKNREGMAKGEAVSSIGTYLCLPAFLATCRRSGLGYDTFSQAEATSWYSPLTGFQPIAQTVPRPIPVASQ